MLLQSIAPQLLLQCLARSRDAKNASDRPFCPAELIQPRKHKGMPLAITNFEPYIANGGADGDGGGNGDGDRKPCNVEQGRLEQREREKAASGRLLG